MKSTRKSNDDIIEELVKAAHEKLTDLESCLYEGADRPNDIYDCGVIDGEYDTWISILNILGVNHDYSYQVS